jgi:hypothetical protein
MVGRARPLAPGVEREIAQLARAADRDAEKAQRSYQALIDCLVDHHQAGDGSYGELAKPAGISKARVGQIVSEEVERRATAGKSRKVV